MIVNYDPQRIELYNLKTDLSEKNKLADKMIQNRDEILKELADWKQSVGAEEMRPNPQFGSTDVIQNGKTSDYAAPRGR